jgi:hypothetical protein
MISIKNNSYEIETNNINLFTKITSLIPLFIIFLALIGNTASFLIFRLDKDMKQIPSMIFLSFVCVTDTLSLFTWNLNHYLMINHELIIENVNIYMCKIFQFIQFFSLESSGLLLSLISVDRYFSIMASTNLFYRKFPFGSIKSAMIWSFSVVIFIGLLNSFLIFMDRFKFNNNDDNFINFKLSNGFSLVIWEKVHVSIYCVIPFIIMIVFNYLLIKKTIESSRRYRKNDKKLKNLTYSLVFLSVSYIIMTLPSTLVFAIMGDHIHAMNLNEKSGFFLLDTFLFLNHSILFFNCFITNFKFRKIVIDLFKKS